MYCPLQEIQSDILAKHSTASIATILWSYDELLRYPGFIFNQYS